MESKLPVLATIVAAVHLCREHVLYALKIMAPWFLIFLITPYLFASVGIDNPAEHGSAGIQFCEALSALVYIIAWGSIAVLWHWRVLRDDSYSRKAVIFDQRVWYYILRGILIGIIVGGTALLLAVPFIFIVSSFASAFTDSIAFFALVACLLIIVGLIAARLSIALPAIALNVPNFGLGDAWNATTGNSIRLLIVTSLPLVPLYLLAWGLDATGTEQSDLFQGSPSLAVIHLIYQVADFAFGLLGLTVLSLTYAFFVERRANDTLQET